MYSDIPTLDQWKKDTTIDGKRDLDVLGWIDDALEDLEKAKSDKELAGNKDVLKFLLLCLGYQVMRVRRYLNDSSPQEWKTAIGEHYDIISKKLKDDYSIGESGKIDDALAKEVVTAMSEHGFKTDVKNSAHYLDDSILWQSKVYPESAALRQYAWWDKTSPPRKSSQRHIVCTLTIPELRIDIAALGSVKVDPTPENIQRKEVIVTADKDDDIGRYLGEQRYDVFCGDSTAFTIIGTEFPRILLTNSTRAFVKIYVNSKGKHYLKRESDNSLIMTNCDDLGIKDTQLTPTTYNDSNGTYKEYIFDTGAPWKYAAVTREVRKTIAGWKSPYGNDIEYWSGYVLGVDGELYMTKHDADSNIFHSCYFAGKPILAAGTIMVDPNGHPIAITNCSGHYKPAAATLLHVLKYFKLKKISLANVVVGAYNEDSLLKIYFAEDFLKSQGRCDPLPWDKNKDTIRDHIYKNRGPYTAPDGTHLDFNAFEFEFNMGRILTLTAKPVPLIEASRCLKVFGRASDGKYNESEGGK